MASILRFRKLYYVEPVKCSSMGFQSFETARKTEKNDALIDPNGKLCLEKKKHQKERKNKEQSKEWRRLDCCCWVIGYMCTMWWILLFIFHSLPATLPGFQVPESPGATLKREGLTAGHPVVLVPGIVTGGLELWEGRPCAEDLFRKRLWGGSFTEIFMLVGASISAQRNRTGPTRHPSPSSSRPCRS